MRNRIKGYWSWDEVGIQPHTLAPAANRPVSRTRAPARSTRPAARRGGVVPYVVAGSLLAGLALAWGMGALLRRA